MTLAIGAFFAPVYLFGPIGMVVSGTAHAAQYAVVMAVLATDRRQGRPLFRVAAMLVVATIYLAFFVVLNDPKIVGAWLIPAQVAAGLIVMWHYMIDAGLWRLRQPFQRDAVKESFPFLFSTTRLGERGQSGQPIDLRFRPTPRAL